MIHAGEAQATGTACLGSNTWPQGVIWLQKWVRYVSLYVNAACIWWRLDYLSSFFCAGMVFDRFNMSMCCSGKSRL